MFHSYPLFDLVFGDHWLDDVAQRVLGNAVYQWFISNRLFGWFDRGLQARRCGSDLSDCESTSCNDGALTVALGYELNAQQWLGFLLITLGCVLVPVTSFRQITLGEYLNVGVFWALIAAFGTTGYSVVDKQALNLLTQQTSTILNDHYSAIFYLGVQFWVMGVPVLLWCIVSGSQQELQTAWMIRKSASMAGIMMASTYGLVLFAMTMTDNVSLVVALRQISIVFGLLMGVWLLAEKWYFTRGVGVLLILSGIILSLSPA